MAQRSSTWRRWPVMLGIVVLIIAVVAATTAFFAQRRDDGALPQTHPSTPISPSIPRPTSTSSVTGQATTLADGCLGGSDPSNAILAAHNKAPLTPEGAAAFGATFLRWVGQEPHGADDVARVGPQVWGKPIPGWMKDLEHQSSAETAWVSVEKAKYSVDKVTQNSATISILVKRVSIQNGETNEQWAATHLSLAAVGGKWRITGTKTPQSSMIEDLLATGLPFKGGC